MIKNETNRLSFEDYVCFSLRKKNELFHRKYINKILYYDSMNSLIKNDDRKNNNFFFTGGYDSIIKLWENNHSINLKLLYNFEHHINSITDLEISNENNFLFSSSYDKSICLWDLNSLTDSQNSLGEDIEKTITPRYIFSSCHNNVISCLKYDNKNDILYSSDFDGKICKIDLNKDNHQLIKDEEIFTKDYQINSIDLYNEGKNLITNFENEISLIDLNGNSMINTLNAHNSQIKKIKINSNYTKFISFDENNIINLWDIGEQKLITSIEKLQNKKISCLYIYKDFNNLLLGLENGQILNFNISKNTFSSFDNLKEKIIDITMNEKENQIIVSLESGLLNIYDFNYQKINFNFDLKIIDGVELKKVNYSNNNKKDLIIKQETQLVKNEIKENFLMNNKIYTIIKYDNGEKNEIINLMKMESVKVLNDIKYEDLIEKIKIVNNDTLNNWNEINYNTGILNMILTEKNCFENSTLDLNFNYIENIVNLNFSINSSSYLYLNKNEIIDSTDNTFGQFILKNLGKYILNEEFEDIFDNFKSVLGKINKCDIFDFTENLFINTGVNGKKYSFYLKDHCKKIIPDFCHYVFKNPFNKLFNMLYQKQVFDKDFSIVLNVSEVNDLLNEDEQKKEGDITIKLKPNHYFKQLIKILIKKIFDKNLIKKKIHKEIIKYKINEIGKEILKDDTYFLKFFYIVIILNKDNIIYLNKKDYYDFKIAYVMKLLNSEENTIEFKIYFNNIKSVSKIFGIFNLI